jgi:hypothetical protein
MTRDTLGFTRETLPFIAVSSLGYGGWSEVPEISRELDKFCNDVGVCGQSLRGTYKSFVWRYDRMQKS